MVSYEKVRQALKTSTIAVAVLSILNIIGAILGLINVFSVLRAFKNGTIDKYNLSAEQLESLKQTISSTGIMIVIVSLIVHITITVFCFINLSKLKQEQSVSSIPYYLGIAVSTLNIILNIIYFSMFNKFSVYAFLIQAAYIVLYFYAIQKARTLAGKEEEE
ncbi:hypothetical protein ACVR0O_06865 [Streptococcus caviae]|uniref:hypothetical protein n=1 Tax=Streptococcus TaxID=1301 RepID=UPI0003FD78BD|nr:MULTISPECIES: hypothetical protein [Streptococcus]OLN83190.1 hypothetical protein BMI76_06275 [Streptococcus sp. 'caviae']